MRPLNPEEKLILMDFKILKSDRPKVISVSYERIVPRATLCTIYIEHKFLFIPLNPKIYHGVTIRSKSDKENYKIGQKWSFIRAVELYLKNCEIGYDESRR